MQLSELFSEIVLWASRNGAENIRASGRPWTGETDEWSVAINASRDEVDNIPPFSAKLEHKVYVWLGVVGPSGGAIVGASEDALIEHFRNAE